MCNERNQVSLSTCFLLWVSALCCRSPGRNRSDPSLVNHQPINLEMPSIVWIIMESVLNLIMLQIFCFFFSFSSKCQCFKVQKPFPPKTDNLDIWGPGGKSCTVLQMRACDCCKKFQPSVPLIRPIKNNPIGKQPINIHMCKVCSSGLRLPRFIHQNRLIYFCSAIYFFQKIIIISIWKNLESYEPFVKDFTNFKGLSPLIIKGHAI